MSGVEKFAQKADNPSLKLMGAKMIFLKDLLTLPKFHEKTQNRSGNLKKFRP